MWGQVSQITDTDIDVTDICKAFLASNAYERLMAGVLFLPVTRYILLDPYQVPLCY